jgi:hypothetical protein
VHPTAAPGYRALSSELVLVLFYIKLQARWPTTEIIHYFCAKFDLSLMITVSKEAFIQGDNPVLSLPGIPEGNYDIVVVLQPLKKRKPRRAGFSKARFVMAADFNAPLDDFKAYM